jgi:hypothetical protein
LGSASTRGDAIEALIGDLTREAASATPTVASLYHAIIHQLRHLDEVKPSGDNLVKAASAINAIAGIRTQQQILLAYMERAFSPGGALAGGSTTEVNQLPPPDEVNE